MGMEAVEEIVIVGAGIAGLATSLGLHRLGIRSIVLESAESLRTTGFALGIWTNGWRALDALGIGDILREKHHKLSGITNISVNSGAIISELPLQAVDSQDVHGARCVHRKLLLETLESELPKGIIRHSSKVVHIETAGCFKSAHLSDGTVLKAKVLIGCDGVNSVVAQFLGFKKPSLVGRSAVRGFVYYEDGHGFEPKFMQFIGNGLRYGVIPCGDYGVYWFFTFSPSPQEEEIVEDPTKLKQFILSKLGKASDKIRAVFEHTELKNMVYSQLRIRYPWELIWGNISKDNVCVAGDAFHPMTPDMGQGGCSALEDSVVLARLLAKALKGKEENDEEKRIQKGLEEFARERRWRNFYLVSASYMVGLMQQSDGVVLNFLRGKMAKFFGGMMMKNASYDCGKLTVS